ncbi:MAG: ADP-glyceromanno-heptose 6-epimerase [Alphaproteobacteria bacterium]|nr:ADP-glyceromanno-heptose 6-epimerase [Alphaproteobacteria bacterium]
MIIVTGAAGFIGSNLVAELEKRGVKPVVACDMLGSDDRWHNLAKRDLYDFIGPDQLFPFLEHHKNRIEVIFHLGAISSTDATDGDLVMANNYRLSLDLFHWCGRHRVRFIYASSAATYGDGSNGFDDSEDNAYLAQLRPMNLYGWSKHFFDKSMLQHVASKDAPTPPQWAGLKFFNVYGPNEHHKGGQSSVIPHLLKQIMTNGSARLFKSYKDGIADGHQARDFVNVHDCVDIMLWLMNASEVSGLFNVGSGQAHTFLDMAHGIFKAIKRDPQIDFIPMPEKLVKHYQYYTKADMTKLRSAGYTAPMTSLNEGIADYVHTYLLKNDPYR